MDMEHLIDAVTKAIMQRLNSAAPKVVVFGDVPEDLICGDAELKKGESCGDVAGCDYIVMTVESFNAIHGGGMAEKEDTAAPCAAMSEQTIDLTNKRLIHERDLRDHNTKGGDSVKVAKNAIVTALAHDYAKGIGAKIVRG